MKKILILYTLLLSTFSLSAEPIGQERARQLAEDFFAEHSTRSTTAPIALEWAGNVIGEPIASGNALNDALLYIYTRGESDGFVVVAGDNNVAPIIAYSLDTSIDTSNMAEATRVILDAWCRQVKDARQKARPISVTSKATTRSYGSLHYDTAIWNQGEPYNREAPVYDGYRCVTGCVATALSIICYYNRWPERGMGTTPEYSYVDTYEVERTVGANTLGRTYDYDNMLFDYNNGYTEAQGNAVAALMKDMGTAVKMNYHYTESGAYDANVVPALINHFDYSRGMIFAWRYSYNDDEWHELIRENLRTYGPTYYRGQNEAGGGHAFVVDGYDSDDYFHFNYGWGGQANGYYRYPDDQFYIWQGAVLNLQPGNDSAPSRDNLLLYPWEYTFEDSGEVLQFQGITTDATNYAVDEPFNCIFGSVANDGTVPYNGEIALILCDASGTCKEVLHKYTIEGLNVGHINAQWPVSITITKDIAVGDRLRLFYKQQNYDEWTWMRSWPATNVYDEAIICASPEEIAKNISLLYDKDSKELWLNPQLPLRLVATDEMGNVYYDNYLGAHLYSIISVVDYAPGTYTLNFTLGSDPYTLRLKF